MSNYRLPGTLLDFMVRSLTLAFGAILLFACIYLLVAANDSYKCTAWHSATGQTTSFIAGACYVEDNGRWELLSAYIKPTRVELTIRRTP